MIKFDIKLLYLCINLMSFICKLICKCAIKKEKEFELSQSSDSDDISVNNNTINQSASIEIKNNTSDNGTTENDKIFLTIDSVDSKIIKKNIINPLHSNSVTLYKYNYNDLNDWECAICFESINFEDTKKNLCIPYKCSHLTCYECFVDYINYKKKKDNNTIINCSLRRKPVTDRWMNTEKITKSTLEYKDLKFKYIYPAL